MKRLGTLVALVLLTASALDAQSEATLDSLRHLAESVPLFASHDVLELRIVAPLTTILADRSQESEYHPGTLAYVDDTGDSVVLDIRAKTRGHFRLQPRICDFPSLRFSFRSEQVAHTVFAGQNRIAIVTHCRDDDSDFEQFTLQEYLIYRSFNELTDRSVRVRLARATYVDTDGERDTLTRYMFFLEPYEMVAARHGWTILTVPAVPPSEHDPFGLPLVEVFQFMIGNTDWSPFQKSTDGSCCHNGTLIGTMAGPVFLVPYDFDWSGVISAPYARPAPEVGVRTVRERRYWGICRPAEEFAPVFEHLNDRRQAIYELWRRQEDLEPSRLARALDYFDEFYGIINHQRRARYEIVTQCRDMSYLEDHVR